MSGITQGTLNNIISGRNSGATLSTVKKPCGGSDIGISEFFAAPEF